MKPKSIIFLLIAMFIGTMYVAQRTADALHHIESSGEDDILAPVAVSDNGKHLVDVNGEPFFWIADTAWGLNQRLTKEEIRTYLDDRKKKGFTVILIKLPHIERDEFPNPKNRYGLRPFINKDVSQPNAEYFELVDYSLTEMQKRGMVAGIVPLWGYVLGGKYNYRVDEADVIFFARWISKRYKDRKNIIWISGGDSGIDSKWVTLGRELKIADPQKLVTYHPGRRQVSSFHMYGDADWLDFHMTQTGHSINLPDNYLTMNDVYNNSSKPILNAEPVYENMRMIREDRPTYIVPAHQIRKSAYWSTLSGGFGHVYGHANAIRLTVDWMGALSSPGAKQMGYLSTLLQSVPWHTFRPLQSLIVSHNAIGGAHMRAAASADNRVAFVYFPEYQSANIQLTEMEGPLRARWFDPQTGQTQEAEIEAGSESVEFTPPYQPDALLILEPIGGIATETVIPPTATNSPIPTNTSLPPTETNTAVPPTVTVTVTATPTATPTVTATATAATTILSRGTQNFLPAIYGN